MQNRTASVVVIGGGPAGMLSAISASKLVHNVKILERNDQLGKKLLITGGGRCNIMNATFDIHTLVSRYGKQGEPLHSVFSIFGPEETWKFFEESGLSLKIEDQQRAFPTSDSSADVLSTLKRLLSKNSVSIDLNERVLEIRKEGSCVSEVVLASGVVLCPQSVILATGGGSHPETGSTGDGFTWAKALGHTVSLPSTALVPLATSDPWVPSLAGLAFPSAKVTIMHAGKRFPGRIGKILFTHEGMSGPLILNISRSIGDLLHAGSVVLSIDFFPKMDAGALDRHIVDCMEHGKNRMVKNAIGEIVPPRLGHVLLALATIDPNTVLHQLSREKRRDLVMVCKDLRVTVSRLLGADKAVVTRGGVALDEVDFKTMRSKKIENLFFAGDILDFDRPSGGYSLQICWSTGYVAGKSAAQMCV